MESDQPDSLSLSVSPIATRDKDGNVLCCHGRPILCAECGEEYAADLEAPIARQVAADASRAGWQPIETAPKEDFKRVLLADGYFFGVGYWGPSGEMWLMVNVGEVHPTHWMPLPSPPASVPEEQP